MTAKIPYLSGIVNNLPSTNKDTLRGRLAISAPFQTTDDIFQVRALRHRAISSYDVLHERGFPMDVFAFGPSLRTARTG